MCPTKTCSPLQSWFSKAVGVWEQGCVVGMPITKRNPNPPNYKIVSHGIMKTNGS